MLINNIKSRMMQKLEDEDDKKIIPKIKKLGNSKLIIKYPIGNIQEK